MLSRGFTLLEVMAVLVLLGLLSAATVFTLTGSVNTARRQDVIDRVRYEDAQARLASRRHDSASLHVDVEHQRMWRADSAGNVSHAYTIPANARIELLLRTSRSTQAHDIPFREGRSETFALRLAFQKSDSDNTGPATTWLVFIGLTGQMLTLENESDVQQLLALAAPRTDTR